MERIWLFCGVWIIIVPILFQNSYFEEHKKYTLSMQIIGFFAFLMGILHFFNIVKKGHYFLDSRKRDEDTTSRIAANP